MCYSLWCNAQPTMLQAEGRQHRGVCITPQAVTQSSVPEDG